MSTVETHATKPKQVSKSKPWPKRDGVFRFTVEQFYRLSELGFFDDRHVELVEGVIFEMTVYAPHATATLLALELFQSLFRPGWTVRHQLPFDTGRRSLPEPDLAVVPGSVRDYAQRHPTEAALVVEVSESTLRKDRTLKAHLYASAGLPEYWIVNLVDRQLEIHRNPGPDPDRKGRFRYAEVMIVPANGHASPLAKPDARIAVADLLP